jgi:hypothetical protein
MKLWLINWYVVVGCYNILYPTLKSSIFSMHYAITNVRPTKWTGSQLAYIISIIIIIIIISYMFWPSVCHHQGENKMQWMYKTLRIITRNCSAYTYITQWQVTYIQYECKLIIGELKLLLTSVFKCCNSYTHIKLQFNIKFTHANMHCISAVLLYEILINIHIVYN